MSAGDKRPFDEVAPIAVRLHHQLAPVVRRLQVAGSLRRRRAKVGDIEIVAEPRSLSEGLFADDSAAVLDFTAIWEVVQSWGPVVTGKRENPAPRQIGVLLPEGIKAELYLVHPPACWGSILAIRTGPADLGSAAVGRMPLFGYRHDEGRVIRIRDGTPVPVPDEETFFACAGLPCLPPRERDTPAAFRPVARPPSA